MAYRDGGQLDAEDSAAQDAVGIRRGQIIQTHDEIQRAIAEMQAKEAGGATPPPPPEQAGDSDAIAQAMKEIDAASWARGGGERGPPGAGGKRRAGFPILPAPGSAPGGGGAAAVGAGVDAIGAARAAGGAGAGGAMLAGATGAGAVLLAQQALAAMKPPEQSMSMAGSSGAVEGEETDLKDLLEVQKQVARVGLPILGGPPTSPGGSIL